jgi:hypothetical protein
MTSLVIAKQSSPSKMWKVYVLARGGGATFVKYFLIIMIFEVYCCGLVVGAVANPAIFGNLQLHCTSIVIAVLCFHKIYIKSNNCCFDLVMRYNNLNFYLFFHIHQYHHQRTLPQAHATK